MTETARLVERIRLEDGTNQDDLGFLERALAQLFTQLSRFDPSQVDIAVRIKDREKPGMTTTLEVNVHGLPTMIGTSTLTDTKDAVNEAEAKVISQLQRAVERRNEHR
jgi:ribosome-associated translation inhibitor RaiA